MKTRDANIKFLPIFGFRSFGPIFHVGLMRACMDPSDDAS